MNAPKCQPEDYIDFLVASPRVVSGTEAARVQPPQADPPAHDAFTRLLHRLEPDPATLWAEAAPQVRREAGVLVLDDSTLDKPYARKMGLLTRHWSGKHRRVVQGINLLTLLRRTRTYWSSGPLKGRRFSPLLRSCRSLKNTKGLSNKASAAQENNLSRACSRPPSTALRPSWATRPRSWPRPRAVNRYRQSGLALEAFVEQLYAARQVTKERTAAIKGRPKADGQGYSPKNKMAYYFAVVEDLIGLRAERSS